jgi:hypothetical protein
MRARPPTILRRRQFLTALGLGGLGLGGAALGLPGGLGWPGPARAGGETFPTRVVFFITPHGTVWNHFHMDVPGLAPTGSSSASLSTLDQSAFSEILRSLHPHRAKLSIVEGLARTGAIEYERAHVALGDDADLNRHHFGQAMLMTCVDPMQRSGTTCIGGGESIDQVIGRAAAVPGRWASRVYGYNHQHPYSFIAAGEASPRVDDARTAFDDILGLYTPPDAMDTREGRIRRARASALDLAAREYDLVAGRVGAADRLKLERHAQLVRDLELSFAGGPSTVTCDPTFTAIGHAMDQFSRVTTLALACDMTRVATVIAPGLQPEEFGLAPGTNVHQDYAHNSIDDGSAYTLTAERGMVDYNAMYARGFANLLDQLDSVTEGDGTLLDHTAVVWMSELATGTHQLRDLPIVVAGNANGFLRTGQYVRYERAHEIGAGWSRDFVGPSQSQLYVTLMRAMGMTNETFGIESVRKVDGSTLSLGGVLPELVA